MKTLEYLFNLYYYYCYLVHRRLSGIFISLVAPILKSEFMRKRQRKFGVQDPYRWYCKFLNDYRHSSTVMDYVDRIYFLWIGIVVFEIVMLIYAPLGLVLYFIPPMEFAFVLIPYLLIGGLALWFTGLLRKKYIEYFDLFEKADNKQRGIYKRIFVCSVIATVVLMVVNFYIYRS